MSNPFIQFDFRVFSKKFRNFKDLEQCEFFITREESERTLIPGISLDITVYMKVSGIKAVDLKSGKGIYFQEDDQVMFLRPEYSKFISGD